MKRMLTSVIALCVLAMTPTGLQAAPGSLGRADVQKSAKASTGINATAVYYGRRYRYGRYWRWGRWRHRHWGHRRWGHRHWRYRHYGYRRWGYRRWGYRPFYRSHYYRPRYGYYRPYHRRYHRGYYGPSNPRPTAVPAV